jgi:hypothetical protein
VLGDIINKALARQRKPGEPKDSFWEGVGRQLGVLPQTEKIKEPTVSERVITLQRRIDDGRSSGTFSLSQEDEFQARLDSIRSNYLLATEGGRSATLEEREVISLLLDSLETDLQLFPRL